MNGLGYSVVGAGKITFLQDGKTQKAIGKWESKGMVRPLCQYSFLGMPAVVRSRTMEELLELAKRASKVDACVLITGESGAGKELIARAVHEFSERSKGPWVDVSCATLPEHLIESELFGHEKGAYSGADSAKPGLFEMAAGGTLFLDEIAELEPRMQAKLLRVLDGAGFYRLGGTRKIQVDVRVVAATNRDLGEVVRAGKFREDLYHRLNQLHLHVPPLRTRREEILPLADFFLAQQRSGVRLTEAACRLLLEYPWPGNVRELRNVVIRAAVQANSDVIRASDLPLSLPQATSFDLRAIASAVDSDAENRNEWSLASMEKRMILRALEYTGGHHQRAAELLGISRRTLSRKLKTFAGGNGHGVSR